MREKKLYSSAHFKYINSLDSFYKHVLKFEQFVKAFWRYDGIKGH